jgi:hypothetical protein
MGGFEAISLITDGFNSTLDVALAAELTAGLTEPPDCGLLGRTCCGSIRLTIFLIVSTIIISPTYT